MKLHNKYRKPVVPIKPVVDEKPTEPSIPLQRQQFLLREAELAKARLEILEDVLKYLVVLRDGVRDRANLAIMELQKGKEIDTKGEMSKELADLRNKVASLEGHKASCKPSSADKVEGQPKKDQTS